MPTNLALPTILTNAVTYSRDTIPVLSRPNWDDVSKIANQIKCKTELRSELADALSCQDEDRIKYFYLEAFSRFGTESHQGIELLLEVLTEDINNLTELASLAARELSSGMNLS